MTKNYTLFLLNQLCVGASVDAKPIIPQFELSQALSAAIKALKQQPCEDCISRQAVINRIANTCFWLSPDNWEELIKCINSISPIDTRPTGQWIVRYPNGAKSVKCNICNNYNQGDVETYFCPNCGAKMIENEE